ncbi:hypothetical protein [Maribacter flavus]|uniref:TonB C-terminal domain-containing protein n=1 Tax=Maribacter flavus TaxID=1658664 RepID=A0A5B2TXP2_9FLAO|nr:hypothetical protein [Maribacter flavus]KAA2218758.1 hypothetical protein F0361_03790 [Maribacter flavus]
MQRILVLLVFLSLGSCNLFQSKEKRTQELINAELREMDWNSVDSYPLFMECDETASKEAQRKCFEHQLTTHFENTLREFEFTVDSDRGALVDVIFVIDAKGKISVEKIIKDAAILRQMPEFDGIITQSLKNIPPIAPALKRGIPVKTKFKIPIQLNTK